MTDKKLKVYRKLSTGGINHPMKMVKMVVPRCAKCNPHGQGKRGWWEECPHDPYFHVWDEPITTPITEERPDGRVIKTGEETEIVYHREPNMKQIADDLKAASGRMVQIQLERGAHWPEEEGYAPICDFKNCWEPNPSWKTSKGTFHSRDEAAIITLRVNETPVYIGLDKDIERRRAQLDAVNIS